MNRDGFHRQTISKGRVNYEPSSIDAPPILETPANRGGFASFPEPLTGVKLRKRAESFADHYSQATLFWQSQTPPEQQHIIEAFQFELGKLTVPAVRLRMLSNLVNVDRELASKVAAVLGVAVPAPSPRTGLKRYSPSPALSMIARGNPKSPVGRKVAILATDGVDAAGLQAVKSALLSAGAKVKVVSTHLGELRASGGGTVLVDDLLVTMPSIVFDAVFIPGGADSVAALKSSGDAVLFVREAFKHAKSIAALGDGAELLLIAGVLSDSLAGSRPAGVSVAQANAGSALAATFLTDIAAHRHWSRPGKLIAA